MKASIGNQAIELEKLDNHWVPKGEENITLSEIQGDKLLIIINGKPFTASLERIDIEEKNAIVNLNGKTLTVHITEPLDELLKSMGMDQTLSQKAKDLKAPMPGLVLAVNVEIGQVVHKGDKLVVLEAMKMENILKSPGDGTISAIHVKAGDAVNKNQKLIDFAL